MAFARSRPIVCLVLTTLLATGVVLQAAYGVVPGTGTPLAQIGDDFEAADWTYHFRLPKSSYNIDHQIHEPGGDSGNGRWAESAKRGQPDVVQRVATPPGGLVGSSGALLLRSRYTGLPGHPSGQGNQDDLLMRVRSRMGGYVPVSWSPNVVVRVLLPPWEQWEDAPGASFALRLDVDGTRSGRGYTEEYWPGMFVRYRPGTGATRAPSAEISIRAAENGGDYQARQITRTGWWTLGMALTPDGRVHYYASPGVDDLTDEDHLASNHPYGFRCRHLDTVIFNVANRDAGRWSTPWIIDDPTVYFARPDTLEAKGRASHSRR